jgi:hypothetical protein
MASLLAKYKITDKASWKAFLLKNHPDKGGDPAIFVAVKNAYETIKPVVIESKPENLSKGEKLRRDLFGDSYKLFTPEEYAKTRVPPPTPSSFVFDSVCVAITKKGTKCTRCVIYPLNVCMQHSKK